MGGEGGVEEKKNEKGEEGIGLGDGGVGGGGSGLLGLDPLLQSVFLFFFSLFFPCVTCGEFFLVGSQLPRRHLKFLETPISKEVLR